MDQDSVDWNLLKSFEIAEVDTGITNLALAMTTMLEIIS